MKIAIFVASLLCLVACSADETSERALEIEGCFDSDAGAELPPPLDTGELPAASIDAGSD